VSFFVAIFLALLLLVSGGLNVLLLVVSIGGFAASSLGGAGSVDDDGSNWELVHVAGEQHGKTRVLRIPINGAIAESTSPLIGAAGGTVSQVRRALKLASRDDEVRAVLLEIDSPGGGVTDSDEIYRMLREFKTRSGKKVVALFGDLAASGGYYVACAADRIIARRTNITGSIGVIMSAWNFSEAAKKFGVEQVAIKSQHTPFKDILSPTRPMTTDEQRLLTGIVEELYQQFVTVVTEGRPGLDRAQAQALATGAIYTANQALQNGLIDEIGDLEATSVWLRSSLGGDFELLEQRRRPGLRELLFGARAPVPSLDATAAQLLRATTGPRFLYFWEGGR